MAQREAWGRENLKEPRANQILPRVATQIRDKEAHFRRIGGFLSQTVWGHPGQKDTKGAKDTTGAVDQSNHDTCHRKKSQ
ncbi:hypothetical protein KI387_008598, partial [Taxus chinensis]